MCSMDCIHLQVKECASVIRYFEKKIILCCLMQKKIEYTNIELKALNTQWVGTGG